jgi:hypothetical protein
MVPYFEKGGLMSRHLAPFIYKLRVVNQTLQELSVVDSQLVEGMWFRDGVDGQGPIAIPPWSDTEVLAIRALKSGTSGYHFKCTWGYDGKGDELPTRIAISINVPFLGGKNKAGLDSSSKYKIEGWTGIPLHGRQFDHTLTLSYRL